ncbi:hypothetical protein JCM16814_30010 [Desulfobaculum senezii]
MQHMPVSFSRIQKRSHLTYAFEHTSHPCGVKCLAPRFIIWVHFKADVIS